MMTRSKVLVSVCNTGWIHKLVTFALLRLQQDPRHQCTIIMPTWRPYEHGLNRVVKDLIELYDQHDFWLNIDSDNPPLNNPLDLVELDLDIVGLPTPVWCDMKPGDRPFFYNAMAETADGWRPVAGDGLTEVDAVGSGCMLIHRRVCESLHKPLFVRETDQDGLVTRGPDFRFCERAKDIGFRVWAHFDYLCSHMVENDLAQQIRAFHAMQGVADA